MKKRRLTYLLAITISMQPIMSVFAVEKGIPTISSEEKTTDEILENSLDTISQEILNSVPDDDTLLTNPEPVTKENDDAKENIEFQGNSMIYSPKEKISIPWGQTVCTFEGDTSNGYILTIKAENGGYTGTGNEAPWRNENYKTSVKKVVFDDTYGKIKLVRNQTDLFLLCSSIETIDFTGVDTSEVTDMENMFGYCTSLVSLDLSNFNTSCVTNMQNMFNECSNLSNLDLSSCDTRQVKKMKGMFSECSKLQCLKLGPQTIFTEDCSLLNSPINDVYTGNWINVGNGTINHPKGDWLGEVSELINRSQTGCPDTYVWEPHSYLVIFDANGGSNTMNQIKVYDEEVLDLSLVEPPIPPSNIYEFTGWSTVVDDETTVVQTVEVQDKHRTLYANWRMLTGIDSVPINFKFLNSLKPDEYNSQLISLNSRAYSSKAPFIINWRGNLDWKLTVTMKEWFNPVDSTDTLTGVQMFMDNQFTYKNGLPAPTTVHNVQHITLKVGETQTLVTTTAESNVDGVGDWQSTIDFDSVKLKIPCWTGREGSRYISQLIWSLDDTL